MSDFEFWTQKYLQGDLDDTEATLLLAQLEDSDKLKFRLGNNVYADFLLTEKFHVAKGVQAAEFAKLESIEQNVSVRRRWSTWRSYAAALAILTLFGCCAGLFGILFVRNYPNSFEQAGSERQQDQPKTTLAGAEAISFQKTTSGHFVSIAQTKNCLWSDSMTRTLPGTRLGKCRMKLQQGIALLRFDCGVAVSIEGPCEFEIKGPKLTALHSGRLVASVETEDGIGFVVDTPGARITDFGTKFCVSALPDDQTAVNVIEGIVEVESKTAANIISLRKGESALLGRSIDDTVTEAGNVTDEQSTISRNINSLVSTIQVSTASGRGSEAWVVANADMTMRTAKERFPAGVFDTFMQVKLSMQGDSRSDRKAIFRMDLGTVDCSKVLNAELILSFGPTEIGYASHVPDATFTVYGLIDETLDYWEASNLTWESFPGNGQRSTLNSSQWIPLGQFEIKQGEPSGTVSVQSEQLREYLHQDNNGLVSFAIVCDTAATESFGLVHGFANRHHPALAPPRLCLTFDNQ